MSKKGREVLEREKRRLRGRRAMQKPTEEKLNKR